MHITKRIILTLTTLAATTAFVCAQDHQASPSAGAKTLVGTWQVSRHGVDCSSGQQLGPDFHALMTFNKGGTYTGYAVSPGGAISNSAPEYGIWARGQNVGQFTFRIVGYNWDDAGTFQGRGEITSTNLQLDPSGDTFSYDATVSVYDADGNLLFSFCGYGAATRFQ